MEMIQNDTFDKITTKKQYTYKNKIYNITIIENKPTDQGLINLAKVIEEIVR